MKPANGAASAVAPVKPSQKLCGVCGERAKSHHFGGMACDSCKAFFRRSVQSEACNHFRCSYDSNCHITISSRKCCQFCRFQKCLKIGMEKKWVMTEEERIIQDKIRKERKRQRKEEGGRNCRPATAPVAECASPRQEMVPSSQLSDQDRQEIDQLVQKFYASYATVPLDPEAPPDSRPPTTTRVVGVFVNAVSRLVSFIATLPQFRQIPQDDQKILLKNGVLAVLILRGTMVYDANSTVFNTQAVGAKVGMNDLQSVMTPKLMKSHQQFVQRMQSLGLDKTTNMLLQMVVMFSSDLAGLTDTKTISNMQDHYTCLIRRYMSSVHGEESTRLLYPRMLHQLADLRTLVEAHNMNTVCFPDTDLANVVGEFSKIDLNPYPMWPDFCEKGKEQHMHDQLHQQHHQQQLQQQGQQRQMMSNSWRRASLPEPAAMASGGGCTPRTAPAWPAHCPPPSSAGASPLYPHTSLGASPQCPLPVAGVSPQTPPGFRGGAARPQCMRASPPSGGQFGDPAGAQCIRSSPPTDAQYSPGPVSAGLDCGAQAGSPSPGSVPAPWPQWGSEPYGAAGLGGQFCNDARQPRPLAADSHRVPPGGDPANCSAPDLDLSSILDWLLAELGPSLQAMEQKMVTEEDEWRPPPQTVNGMQQYLPQQQQQQQELELQQQQRLQQQQQQQFQQQSPMLLQQQSPMVLQHPQYRTSCAGTVPGGVYP